MVDEAWLKDFALRCSREHRPEEGLVDELAQRLQGDTEMDRGMNLAKAVGGLATIAAALTWARYAAAGVPAPDFFTVSADFLATLPDAQHERDMMPAYAAAQIVTAMCNRDQAIGVQLTMAACFAPTRPELFGQMVAVAIMRHLHQVCQHVTPALRVL
jgi:hypothetical protein